MAEQVTRKKKIIAAFICIWLVYQAADAMIHFYNAVIPFLLLMATCTAVAWWWGKTLWKDAAKAYGLVCNSLGVKHLLLGFALAVLMRFLHLVVSIKTGKSALSTVPSWQVLLPYLPLVIAGTLLPSLAEDLLTRAFVMRALGYKIPVLLASTVVYVLNHTYRLGSGPEVWCYLAVTGVVLAWPLLFTRSLWFTLGLHWGINAFYRLSQDVLLLQSGDKDSLWPLTAFTFLLLPLSYFLLKGFSAPSRT